MPSIEIIKEKITKLENKLNHYYNNFTQDTKKISYLQKEIKDLKQVLQDLESGQNYKAGFEILVDKFELELNNDRLLFNFTDYETIEINDHGDEILYHELNDKEIEIINKLIENKRW